MLALAEQNLLTPMILCFGLGLIAALARSDLTLPEAVAKGMSLYLLIAIASKGGRAVSDHGIDSSLISAQIRGAVLSIARPLVGLALLRAMTAWQCLDAAAVAAHFGSISIVTFVAASSVLTSQVITSEGYRVAVAATMQVPAISLTLALGITFLLNLIIGIWAWSVFPTRRSCAPKWLWRP